MARFPHVRAAFNQTAFIESLNLPAQVLADIWLPVGFPPVSFEPLNEEEEKVAQTGQFANTNARTRNAGGNNPNYSPSTSGEYRNNPRGNRQNQQQQGNRSRGSSFVSNSRSFQFSQNQHNHHSDEDVIEDPDNLWATPSSDTFGSADFGTFDENGMFRAAPTGSSSGILDGGLEDDFGTSSSASAAAFEGFMQTRHHHTPSQPTVPAVPAAPLSPPVAIPHITPDTQWLYRDPSGQIQGPFPSHRMIEWYNGKYFPENLPLRREQDAFFEPLSTWKTKCAGQVPFIAYTVPKAPEPPKQAEKPLSFGSIQRESRTESVSVSEWFSEPTKPVASAIKPAIPSVTVNPAPVQTTRSVPIESLFSLPMAPSEPAAPIEKPASPEVMMPTWKKLEKPSVTAKFGQMSLDTDTEVNDNFKVVEPVKVVEPIKTVEPVKSVEPTVTPAPAAVPATSSWSTSPAASTGSLKKISLSEIMKSGDEPKIILDKPQAQATVVDVPLVPNASGAGWAKLSSTPVQSLSSIQAEEASRQRATTSTAPASSSSASAASKSFADLVRSAGVIQGNIVVSPSVTVGEQARPLTERKASFSGMSGVSSSVNSSVNNSVNSSANKPSASATTVPTVTTNSSNNSAIPTAKPTSIEDWCVASLKQSPALSKSIDPQTCTFLLMDLPSPSALLTFALETLKPLESTNSSSAAGNFDLAAFAQEFSTKKFGAKATEKVQWSKLKTVPQVKKQEESFETVKRKK